MMDRWVLDVSNDVCSPADRDGDTPRAFCPLDEDNNVLVGMTYVSDLPPGSLVGVFHQGGREACEAWCEEHPEDYARIFTEAHGRAVKRVADALDGTSEDAIEEQRAQDRASAESEEFLRRNGQGGTE